MFESRLREFVQAMVVAAIVILGYEGGDFLAEYLVTWQKGLDTAEKLLGMFGFYMLSTADVWLGWFLGGFCFLYLRRLALYQNMR